MFAPRSRSDMQLSIRNRILLTLIVTAALLVALFYVVVGIGALSGAVLQACAVTGAVIVIVAGVSLTRSVTRPLREVVVAARALEAGEDASFGSDGRGEIGQLATALDSMRIRMRDQQQALTTEAKQATTINRFMDAGAFVEDENSLARVALDTLLDLTGALDATIHIVTPARDSAAMVAQSGEIEPADVAIGVLDNCPGVRRGALYLIPDLGHAVSVHCPVFPAASGTMVCLPLTAAGDVVGVAHLRWRETRTVPLPLRVAVNRVTDHAGMTLSNRRLLAALRQQSQVDIHTGLTTQSVFDVSLERAAAGRRRGHRVALLLIDIDDMSGFNDRNGKPAGDDALRFFARTLNGCLRVGDTAGRYGPEEFAVLLAEVAPRQAIDVAERIRRTIEAATLPVGLESDEKMTVSIGVATAPEDAESRVGLLRAADQALYEAKISGRNRVVSAGDLVVEDDVAPDEPIVRAHMITIRRTLDTDAAAAPETKALTKA